MNFFTLCKSWVHDAFIQPSQHVFFSSLFLVGPGHVLIAAYDERTCSQLRDVSTTSYTEDYFVPDNLLTTEEVL